MLSKCRYLLVVLLVLLTACGSGPPSTPTPEARPTSTASGSPGTWIQRFTGDDYGAFLDLTLTPDGNILAVGSTNHRHVAPYTGDALLVELDLQGHVLWERTWGGDGYEQAFAVAPAGAGGFYVFGETSSHGAGDRDFFLLKVTARGSEEWFRTYGRERREWPYGMLPLANGDLLLFGFSERPASGERDQYALRVRPDGEVIWQYIGEASGEDLVLDALETEAGHLVLTVSIQEDGALVELDANGQVQWTRRYELAGWQYASQIEPVEGGQFLLAGFAMSGGSSPQADTWLARCGSTGELLWQTTFGEPAFDDYGTSLIRLKDGTYLIGAIADGVLLSRVDQDGKVLWRRSLLGPTVHGAMALAELEQGGYLVAGLIQLVNGRSYDAILLRTDADGRVAE